MALRQDGCLATRKELAADAMAVWRKAMAFEGPGPSLPPMMDGQDTRKTIRHN